MGKQRALSRVFFSWHRGRERDSALVSSCLSRFLGSFKSCEREFWSERLHAQTRPPIASKRPFLKEAHGIKWNDPYHWMSSPSEKAHLTEHVRRENRYADVIMADTLPLQHRLVQEMEGRISAELVTPPERWGSWYGFSAYEEISLPFVIGQHYLEVDKLAHIWLLVDILMLPLLLIFLVPTQLL